MRLRDCYVQARELGSSLEAHANLEWILGARRNPTQDPLGFESKTVEVVALWLQDLATELDPRRPGQISDGRGEKAASIDEASRSVARKLRDATERFRAAFIRPV